MKASIDRDGIITLTSESDLEDFALDKWKDQAMEPHLKPLDDWSERYYIRPSKLVVRFKDGDEVKP